VVDVVSFSSHFFWFFPSSLRNTFVVFICVLLDMSTFQVPHFPVRTRCVCCYLLLPLFPVFSLVCPRDGSFFFFLLFRGTRSVFGSRHNTVATQRSSLLIFFAFPVSFRLSSVSSPLRVSFGSASFLRPYPCAFPISLGFFS